MSSDLNNARNANCLENIFAASEQSNIHAAKDIYDIKGIKLLAAGQEISNRTKDRLLDRKLLNPLETSIAIENAVSSEQIGTEAINLVKRFPALSQLSKNAEAEAKQLKLFALQPFAAVLLTVMRDNGTQAFEHTVLVMLLSRMIANRMKLDNYTLQNLTVASALHDIGELYVPREHLRAGVSLTPHEWRNVMVHPLIGSKVIATHMNYPKEVARAVMEHHERADGTGYPNKIKTANLSVEGEILIVAEMLAAMLTKPNFPIQRALLVMKLLPGEYPYGPMSALHLMVNSIEHYSHKNSAEYAPLERVKAVIQDLDMMIEHTLKTIEIDLHLVEKNIALGLKKRLYQLKQAVISIGIEHCFHLNEWDAISENHLIRMEVEVAAHEIAWRMRDMARDMILDFFDANHEPSEALGNMIGKMSSISVR